MKIRYEIVLPIIAFFLVTFAFSFIQLEKVKPLDCKTAPDVYYLKPSELSNVQPILKQNENALVVIPDTNEIRANTKLLDCPNINLNKYFNFGGN